MPRKSNATDYYVGLRKNLENVAVPDKVKCIVCSRVRMKSAFSKRQLDIVREAIFKQGQKATNGCALARCRMCVSGQAVELKCNTCRTTKNLEEFAKAQRADRDNARCKTCVQRQSATVIALENKENAEEQKENKKKELQDSISETDDEDADEIVDGMKALTFENSDNDDDDDEDDEDDDDQSVEGGVWCDNHVAVASSDEDDDGKSTKGKRASLIPFNSKQEKTPTGPSLTETANTEMVVTNPAPSDSPPKRESKFAKVKAYVPGPDENLVLLLPEPESGGEPDSDPDSGGFEEFV